MANGTQPVGHYAYKDDERIWTHPDGSKKFYPPALDATEFSIRQACNDLANTLISKRKDYGRQNFDEFGTLGILVRLSDKRNRLLNLTDSGRNGVVNESIQDTWLDLAGYAMIGLLYSEGKW